MPEVQRVVVSGASGLIGTALVESLRADGIHVTTLVRRPARSADEISWLQDATPLDPAVLAGADAVVALGGASVGHFPWTHGYKSELLWSRLTPTRTIATALRALGPDAPAFVSASAVGFYGSQPGVHLNESSPAGDGFLARLTVAWEDAARQAGPASRVTLLRTAPVVHERGVLKPLLLLTKLGASGPIGPGTQVWPWISLPDEVGAIRHILREGIDGPVNLTGPTRATANDLGFALARRMNRPFVVHTPVWGMKLALGADATAALLTNDADVAPQRLLDSGYRFAQATVEDAVAEAVPAAD